jgi:hypothetical protein
MALSVCTDSGIITNLSGHDMKQNPASRRDRIISNIKSSKETGNGSFPLF